jgi:hypothetical protein
MAQPWDERVNVHVYVYIWDERVNVHVYVYIWDERVNVHVADPLLDRGPPHQVTAKPGRKHSPDTVPWACV